MPDLIPFKYQQVTSKALDYIESHGLKPGQRLPSERDFAEAIGVSRPTVNKALACLIAEGRLRREGYKLYVAAPAPETSVASVSIAVMSPHPLRQKKVVSHNLMEAAHDTCEPAKVGFSPLLSTNGLQQREQLQTLLRNDTRHQGIVIWPHADSHCEDLLRQCVSRGIPVVVNDLDVGPFDFVGIDNRQGVDLAVGHLVELGHREIAYFTRHLAHDSLQHRREGFDYAIHRLLGPKASREVYELPDEGDAGLPDLFARFLRESPRATAICCSHDFVALELLRLCRERGMAVPGDLSIVGFDGIDASETSFPPLTTAAQDFYHMGVLAVEQLIRRIRHPQVPHVRSEQKVRVSPRLIVRGSTGAPRKSTPRRRRETLDTSAPPTP